MIDLAILAISSLAALVATAWLIGDRASRYSAALWLLALYTVWQLQVTLVGRGLALFGWVGSATAWVAADLLYVVAAAALWTRRGRPRVIPERHPGRLRDAAGPAALWLAGAVMATAVAGLTVVLFLASVKIPQNTDDVLTAYLPRVGYWIQQGDFSHIRSSTYNSLQSSYPLNSQIAVLRSVLVGDSWRLAGLEQWMGGLVSAVGIFAVARLLRAARGAALFAAGTWLLMPVVVSESGLAFTDLVAVAPVLVAVAFGIAGWQHHDRFHLAVAGAALSLAVGTKQTVMFALPGLALLLAWCVLRERHRWRTMVYWLVGTLPVMVIVGIDRYITNWRYYGHPLGDPDSFEYFAKDASAVERIRHMFTNLRQTAVDMYFSDMTTSDAARFPRLVSWAQRYERFVGTEILLREGLPWTGFFATLVVTVGVVAACVLAARRRDVRVLVVIVPAIVFVVAFYWTRPNFSPAFSRYILIPVALLLVATAIGLSSIPVRRRFVTYAAAALALIATVGMTWQAAYAAGHNGTRPLWGDTAIWSASPVEAFAYSTGWVEKQPFIATVIHVDSCFAPDATVATLLPTKFPHQLLFATSFERTVRQYVELPGPLDAATFEELGIDAFVIETAAVTLPDDEALDVVDFGSVAVIGLRSRMAPGC